MRIIKRIFIALLVVILLAITNNGIFFISLEQTVKAADEEENIDIVEVDEIIELGIWEQDGDAEVGKIFVGWNETTSLTDIEKYELSLYKEDGSFAGEVVEVAYQNETAIDNVSYGGEDWDYKYEFNNIEEGTYYCTIRVSSSEVDSEGNENYIWSEYTQSDLVIIKIIIPVSVAIDTVGWTNNTAPKLTWEGITVDAAGEVEVQYKINNGDWVDSNWTGESGTGTFDSSNFVSDGEYKIKIRGKITVTDDEAGVTETVFGEESEAVAYQRDVSAPIADILRPKSASTFNNSVKIKGSILDGGSGIKSWVLEYESNAKQGEWKKITSGNTELAKNTTLDNWDTSDLKAGFYTIRLTVVDNDNAKSISTQSVTVEKIKISGSITPINVRATVIMDTDISAQIYWEDTSKSEDITYNVYRSLDADFTEPILVATDIAKTTWIDMDILYGQEYYYKVSSITEAKESKLATDFVQVKLDKMLGLEDYWEYNSFETDSGEGYINVANGNLVYSAVDSIYTNLLPDMPMHRTYNSQSSTISPLGYGWDFCYNICLYQEKDSNNDLIGMILKDSDGSRYYFSYDSLTGTYTSPCATFMKLTYNITTGEHTIIRSDYISYIFGDDLKLTEISGLDDNYITFEYDIDGKLITAENNLEEKIVFNYYQEEDDKAPFFTHDSAHIGLLAQMTDTIGRSYVYAYKQDEPILTMASLETTALRDIYSYADESYQLVRIKDTGGNETVIDYTKNEGKVANAIISNDEYYEFNYVKGTTIMIDSLNGYTEYDYDSNGCVTRIMDAAGNKASYTYNDNLQVVEAIYDKLIDGRLSATSLVFTYDDDTGKLLAITDQNAEVKLE